MLRVSPLTYPLTAECGGKVFASKYADLWAQRDSWNSTNQSKELDFGIRKKKETDPHMPGIMFFFFFKHKQTTTKSGEKE